MQSTASDASLNRLLAIQHDIVCSSVDRGSWACLEVLSHASSISRCESRVLLLVLLRRGSLHSCSSPLGLGLCHQIPQVEVAPGSYCVCIVAVVMLVLEVLYQSGMVLQALAACQTMHIACSRCVSVEHIMGPSVTTTAINGSHTTREGDQTDGKNDQNG